MNNVYRGIRKQNLMVKFYVSSGCPHSTTSLAFTKPAAGYPDFFSLLHVVAYVSIFFLGGRCICCSVLKYLVESIIFFMYFVEIKNHSSQFTFILTLI